MSRRAISLVAGNLNTFFYTPIIPSTNAVLPDTPNTSEELEKLHPPVEYNYKNEVG